ncbi:MAG TPA: trypsin-like peptidase domain-containing protein, partial [Steroidobacteraceae bacterium]|nr:trypsin-like peptidase domain-containing protein [Steroidobacteraceae bacterium]
MLKRLGSALIFVAGSVVGGLALAFLIVALRPDLIRATPRAAEPAAPPTTTGTPAAAVAAAAPQRVSYAAAVQRAAPAVVNIYTARAVTERLAPSLGELFGEYGPRYRQRIERSLGSGVIVDESGHIVTNHHVIANADSILVQLEDGRVANARIVGRDPDTDLAVLKIDLSPLPVVSFGRSDQLRAGDVVLAIGNPIGLSHTVTHGIVSAVSRQQLGIAPLEDFIQTDAPINFGNSGGALIDSSGALVGINTAIVAKSLGVEGIGFAIPVNMVRGVLNDIIAHGRVVRGWIGIIPQDLPEEQAHQFGLSPPRPAVLIENLYVNSPALRAGLQPGDLLLAINGTTPANAQDALGRIAGIKPGTSIVLRGLREGHVFEVRAQVGERPRSG